MLKVHRNDTVGFQFEFDGVLLTLRPHPDHGISGSIAIKEDGKVRLVSFHGRQPELAFPLEVHNEGELK